MHTTIKMIAYWATTAFVTLETNAAGVTDRVHGGTRLVGGKPAHGWRTPSDDHECCLTQAVTSCDEAR